MGLSGVAKIIYNSITRRETLEERQAEYIRMFNVKAYKQYQDTVNKELVSNGYSDVIVPLEEN